MRIAYFTESLFPHVDGVSRTLAQLFRTLEHRGVDFRVYSPFVPENGVSWSARVQRVPAIAFPLYRDYKVSIPSPGLAAELDEYQPDLLHLVSPTPMAAWAQRYAARAGLPVVSSFHTHFVSYLRYYGMPALEEVGWALLRRFYTRCDAVYAPSPAIIEELAEHGIEGVQLWSRGIELEKYSPGFRDAALRERVGADAEHPLLLLVSRLVKEKDLKDLVAMHEILRAQGSEHRLVLVGEGPMREELEAALPDAYFAGHQEGEALSRWYASADVFVFPSTTETFGNVVLESLASGVPAVVVDRGGPPGLIRAGVTGRIARANDPADLAEHVGALLAEPELRRAMGQHARESAAERDWSVINGRLIESYAAIVGTAVRLRAAS